MSDIKSGDDSGRRRKDGGIVPPISLIGLFGFDEGDDADEKCVDGIGGYVNNYENQLVTIDTIVLTIRQYSFHRTNANQVWPGTFVLADFISQRQDRYFCHGHDACTVLELGAATGVLAIYLRMMGLTRIVTTDIKDDGEVAENILFNTQQNGLEPQLHIPHTWGTTWEDSRKEALALVVGGYDDDAAAADDSDNDSTVGGRSVSDGHSRRRRYLDGSNIRFIIASDILLYVSSYPDLVKTIVEVFDSNRGTIAEFLMSWNRRIASSKIFFELMSGAGFECHHHGKCVYSFFRRSDEALADDVYLIGLQDDAHKDSDSLDYVVSAIESLMRTPTHAHKATYSNMSRLLAIQHTCHYKSTTATAA